jgi:ketosteroid isomerase-like protein
MSDEQRVREANERFYAAMTALDIDEMDEVWMKNEAAVCVHPGREAINGYEHIRQSWAAIFSAPNPMSIAASNEHVSVAGDVAWIVCSETISMMTDEGLAAAAAQATNIFQRVANNWRMILHHASPIPFTTPDEWPDVIN